MQEIKTKIRLFAIDPIVLLSAIDPIDRAIDSLDREDYMYSWSESIDWYIRIRSSFMFVSSRRYSSDGWVRFVRRGTSRAYYKISSNFPIAGTEPAKETRRSATSTGILIGSSKILSARSWKYGNTSH